MEIEFGLALKRSVAERIRPPVFALLESIGHLAFDDDDAREAGKVRAELHAPGHQIGFRDAMITGCARRRALTLVTHYQRAFQRVDGLATFDWRGAPSGSVHDQ